MISEDGLKFYESWIGDYHQHYPHYKELIAEIRRLRKRVDRAEDLLEQSRTWYGDNRIMHRKVGDFLSGSER